MVLERNCERSPSVSPPPVPTTFASLFSNEATMSDVSLSQMARETAACRGELNVQLSESSTRVCVASSPSFTVLALDIDFGLENEDEGERLKRGVICHVVESF